MKPRPIARLSIRLEDVTPEVKRMLAVPVDIRLDRLHELIQAAMGWTDSHLYEFRVRDIGWGIPDPDWNDNRLDAREATLWEVMEDTGAKTLRYLYDFGDSWYHVIKIERLFPPDGGDYFPLLLSASGRCPPEDIGGAFAYQEFLAAIANPKHPRHAEMKEWWSDDFDPDDVPIESLNAAVEALARAWNRKPRRTRPKPPAGPDRGTAG